MHWVQSISVGIISVLVLACSSPTQPPGVVTPDFIVATGMNVIAVGNSTRFTVTAYTRDPSRDAYFRGVQQAVDVSASASWASDNPAIATVSSKNIVGRAAGVANVSAQYMGREYTIPVYVVVPSALAQQFAGTWSGGASRFCRDLIGETKSCLLGTQITEVSMSLTNVGGLLQGSIDIGGVSFEHVTGPITGSINEDRDLVIGGVPGLSEHDYAEQLRDWRFTLSSAQLIGSGTGEVAFVNIYGPVWQRITYTTITLH